MNFSGNPLVYHQEKNPHITKNNLRNIRKPGMKQKLSIPSLEKRSRKTKKMRLRIAGEEAAKDHIDCKTMLYQMHQCCHLGTSVPFRSCCEISFTKDFSISVMMLIIVLTRNI